jgi:serine/threonine-protein kinase
MASDSQQATSVHGRRLVPERLRTALRPSAATAGELPAEAAREARRRILAMALLGFGAYAAFLGLAMSGLSQASSLQRSIDITHDSAGLALCACLSLVALSSSLADRSVFAVALACEVLLTALISVAVTWAGFVRTAHVGSLTWASVVIILFSLLVPMRPVTTLLVSALGAATMPGALWLLGSRGLVEVHASDYWMSCVTGAVVIGVATLAARTLHGAREQVAAAHRVGTYELLERLGQGGMGEVWKARHLLLARPAAIKRVRPDALRGAREEQDAVLRRFTREAQVTASLRSPHTVELFDFGVSTDGTLYYAMELLDGLNAEHFVYRFGPLEPRRAVHWLRQVCHSLGEAHARGLIHRDIKPANLVVCRYGRDADFVKVLDFGLTRAAAGVEDGPQTAAGARLGTPGYMAPEQVFGLEAGPRTDLYALGCVGYWLLAGRRPFEAESSGEILRLHAQEAPPPLTASAGSAMPPRLEAIIMSCLAKDPKERPASADALSESLGCALESAAWSADEAGAWWDANLPEFGAAPA